MPRTRVVALVLLIGLAPLARAQLLVRPWLDWRTVQAGRFRVHFPAELAPFARFVAERMPAVDSAVSRVVGYSPKGPVDIVVEDPFQSPNGMAFTIVEKPVVVFWATPPDPRLDIGEYRTWGEMLASHEFAHVAHLARPSRNRLTRALWRALPVDLGPIAIRAPRWAIEGYATYVEGIVTNTGRPHGFWRAAILRQWALEGRLPTYAQLSRWGDFEGGSFAYLAGSAFLEWLVERPGAGDSSLVHVWRRLSARRTRGFDEAFAGVFGESPRMLYGRFSAELTASAMAAEQSLAGDGLVSGEMIQHLAWQTGDPAVSPHGDRVAVVLRSHLLPSRVVVWRTTPESDSARLRADSLLVRRDPEDVPARRVYPAPKHALATLRATTGSAFGEPRWFANGEQLLVSRLARRPDGSYRSDLYRWDVSRGDVRRLTNGAGVRDADPAPDGRWAAALHCGAGHCDVVRVDLARGSWRTLIEGDERTSFAHPRVAPDGERIVVAMQRDDRWRVAIVPSTGSTPRPVDVDDGADRFDPAWMDDTTLVVSSDASGTANLERIVLGAGGSVHPAQPLTRVTGAAVAPAPDRADGSIWFLSLHARGWDVRRLARDSAAAMAPAPRRGTPVLLDPALAPASAARTGPGRSLPAITASVTRGYGLGDRTSRLVPHGAAGADGRAVGLGLSNLDVVGRLSVLAQGVVGSGSAWRGGAIDAAWRGARPSVQLSAFAARTALGLPSRSGAIDGARLRTDYRRHGDAADVQLALGASAMRVHGGGVPYVRNIGFLAAGASARQRGDAGTLGEWARVGASTGTGRDGARPRRVLASTALRGEVRGLAVIDLRGSYGRVIGATTDPFEQFVVGGLPVELVDSAALPQRIAMPALPLGVAVGDRVASYRAATRFGLVEPFYWGASARDGAGRFVRWHRVWGAELVLDQESLAVLGTPGVRVRAGVSRSLDIPFANRTRAYAVISLEP